MSNYRRRVVPVIATILVLGLLVAAVLFGLIQLIQALGKPAGHARSSDEIVYVVEMAELRNKLAAFEEQALQLGVLHSRALEYLDKRIDRLDILEGYRQHKEQTPMAPDPQAFRADL